jgi:ribosomal protein L7/L12
MTVTVNRKNIIAAALKISKMNSESIEALALKLLDTNPTIVLRALEIGVPEVLWKVAIVDRNNCQNKINVIKAFREITGHGLADSKAWSEGQTVGGFPSGVFGHGLNREAANELWKRVTMHLSNLGIKVEVVSNETVIPALPYTWSEPSYR